MSVIINYKNGKGPVQRNDADYADFKNRGQELVLFRDGQKDSIDCIPAHDIASVTFDNGREIRVPNKGQWS